MKKKKVPLEERIQSYNATHPDYKPEPKSKKKGEPKQAVPTYTMMVELARIVCNLQTKVECLENKVSLMSLQEENRKKEKTEPKKEYKRPRAVKGYCAIDDNGNIALYTDCGTDRANYRYTIGNYYSTVEKAERAKEKQLILQELKDLATELNAGEKIDWFELSQRKYHIICSHNIYRKTSVLCLCSNCNKSIGEIYCLSDKFLEVALERIGLGRLEKLFEEE